MREGSLVVVWRSAVGKAYYAPDEICWSRGSLSLLEAGVAKWVMALWSPRARRQGRASRGWAEERRRYQEQKNH